MTLVLLFYLMYRVECRISYLGLCDRRIERTDLPDSPMDHHLTVMDLMDLPGIPQVDPRPSDEMTGGVLMEVLEISLVRMDLREEGLQEEEEDLPEEEGGVEVAGEGFFPCKGRRLMDRSGMALLAWEVLDLGCSVTLLRLTWTGLVNHLFLVMVLHLRVIRHPLPVNRVRSTLPPFCKASRQTLEVFSGRSKPRGIRKICPKLQRKMEDHCVSILYTIHGQNYIRFYI